MCKIGSPLLSFLLCSLCTPLQEFIYDLPAGRAQDALDAAIRGKGAFRRFKDRLYDFDLQEKWYKYRDDCYEQIARDWCERFGIEIEE